MLFTTLQSIEDVPGLGQADLHVWLADISDFIPDLSFLMGLLSQQEQDQAQRFIKKTDCERFIVSHGLLRLILALYLGVLPTSLLFEKMKGGKPRLKLAGGSNLDYNLSHSGNRVLIGVTKFSPVGVDIEFMRSNIEIEPLIERICTPRERDTLLQMSESDRLTAFYRCWTLKESFVKAIGKGLAFPLSDVEVRLDADEPFAVQLDKKDNTITDSWFLRSVDVVGDYQTAITNKEAIKNLSYFQCQDLKIFN